MALFLRDGQEFHELAAQAYDAERMLQELPGKHPGLLAAE